MNKKNKNTETEQCTIPDVRCSTIFKPTMKLRWLKTEVYIPELDEFEKILQQCWLDEHGNEIWEDIPIFE